MLGINGKKNSEKILFQSISFCYFEFPIDKYMGTIIAVMNANTKAVVTTVYCPTNGVNKTGSWSFLGS